MSEPRPGLTDALADRYTIERELGQGGMATVYLAQDLKHDRKVAIKVLREDLSVSLGKVRFLQEIRVAARLQHPNILALFDSGIVETPASMAEPPSSFLYYVMPYIEGETLRDRLARTGPLSVAETIRLTGEIADALGKAHRAGVVHRDIKPENILLADGHALVMDFGVAKALSEATGQQGLTSGGLSIGTPAYMAPEQVAADPHIDHRADIYALGLVAYEMLAGGSPYAATTPQQQMAAHVTQPAAPISSKRVDCPDDLAGVVMKCLAKNPTERWQTAEEVVDQLHAVKATTPRRRQPLTTGRIVAIGTLGAMLVVGVLYVGRFAASTGSAAGDRTVGVMLFDNLAKDSTYAYLADGLAAEIATSLARVPRLEVRSPGAVRSAQRGIDPDPREVGRRLNVRNVVEGEFQRGGDRIRIGVRLVAVPSGTQRWGDSWTRPITDLLAVQEEIARAVATAIAGELLPAERTVLATRPTSNPEAYDHYLRGNFLLAGRTPAGTARALEEFDTAFRLDTAFAQAAARIALGYAVYVSWGWDFPGVPRDSLLARGFHAADRALALDSLSADGWLARGNLLYLRDTRAPGAGLQALRRATELNPLNAEAWHQYGTLLMIAGRYEAGITSEQRALKLEPGRPISLVNTGESYQLLRRDTVALAYYDSAVTVDPNFHSAYSDRAWVRLRMGDTTGARADAETALRLSPVGDEYYGLAPLAAVAAAAGDTAQARELMAQALTPFIEGRPLGELPAQSLVFGLVASGQKRLALHWLERARPRGVFLWWAMQFPPVDAIRDDPRFQRVMAESRPPEAQ